MEHIGLGFVGGASCRGCAVVIAAVSLLVLLGLVRSLAGRLFRWRSKPFLVFGERREGSWDAFPAGIARPVCCLSIQELVIAHLTAKFPSKNSIVARSSA